MTRGGPPPQSKRNKKVEEQKTPPVSAHQSASAGKDDRSTLPLRAGPPPRSHWEFDEPKFEMLTPKSNSKPESAPAKPRSEVVKPPLARTWGRAGAPPLTRTKSDASINNRVGPIMMTVETTTSIVAKTESESNRFKHEIGVPMILPREPPPRHDSLKRRDTPFTNTVSYYKATNNFKRLAT